MLLSTVDRQMEITNYESALEWGKTALSLGNPREHHKVDKSPSVYYQPARPETIVINQSEPVKSRAELPLVSHVGSLASKLRWDDKGAIRISKSKTTRFDKDSYLGEKPFLKDNPTPLSIPDTSLLHKRSPSHIFPGLKRPLEPRYLENKKALFLSII